MEFIYVVKRYDLFDLAFPHGFVLAREPKHAGGNERIRAPADSVHDVTTYMERARKNGFFVERRWAERDSSLKQIIPYTLVSDGSRVLQLRRLKKGGEPRLHGKLSIGVGGHINPPDAEHDPRDKDLIAAGAWRELSEEIHIQGEAPVRVVGLVNDESNPVGSVHLGVVCLATLKPGTQVKVREVDQLEGEMVPAEDVMANANDPDTRMETWSSLVAKHLKTILTSK